MNGREWRIDRQVDRQTDGYVDKLKVILVMGLKKGLS